MEADDEDDVVLEAPGLVLERDSGCMRWLSWSCRFTGRSVPEVIAALQRSGHRDASRLAGLLDFELPSRHRLVIVPATDRVQLRLDVEVPREQRQAEALRVGTWLAALVG